MKIRDLGITLGLLSLAVAPAAWAQSSRTAIVGQIGIVSPDAVPQSTFNNGNGTIISRQPRFRVNTTANQFQMTNGLGTLNQPTVVTRMVQTNQGNAAVLNNISQTNLALRNAMNNLAAQNALNTINLTNPTGLSTTAPAGQAGQLLINGANGNSPNGMLPVQLAPDTNFSTTVPPLVNVGPGQFISGTTGINPLMTNGVNMTTGSLGQVFNGFTPGQRLNTFGLPFTGFNNFGSFNTFGVPNGVLGLPTPFAAPPFAIPLGTGTNGTLRAQIRR